MDAATGSTSTTTCYSPGTSDLTGTSLSLAQGSASTLVASGITTSQARIGWPISKCAAFVFDVDGDIATARQESCGWTDAASGQGTWQVMVTFGSITFQIDDAMLTISGSQTVSNLNDSGSTCTATLAATATRS